MMLKLFSRANASRSLWLFRERCTPQMSIHKSFSISHTRFQEATDANAQSADCEGGPLSGIRVLDLSRILAAPYCTMLLGDLGAEIIKVEKPDTGDDTRSWGPPYVGDMSCYFVCTNRNKKSLAIDLKKGSHILRKLAEKCDVLVENYLPGTLDKYGLGFEELRHVNPGLIYCSLSGYGATGPYKSRGGYDVIVSGIGGLMHITGPRSSGDNNTEPCKAGVALTDISTGLYLHGAIMAALLERAKTKKGQQINCNLLSTQIALLVNIGSNYINAGREANRWGSAHESIVPYQAFQTKDNKWIIIGAANDKLFYQLCDILKLQDVKTSEKFLTNPSRVQNREELIAILQDVFRKKSCNDWLGVFEDEGCRFPYGPVNDLKDAFNDPQVVHNGLVQQLGPYKIVGPPVQYSTSVNKVRTPPPLLGQHTTEVLKGVLNLSSAEIEKLYSDSIIQ